MIGCNGTVAVIVGRFDGFLWRPETMSVHDK